MISNYTKNNMYIINRNIFITIVNQEILINFNICFIRNMIKTGNDEWGIGF